MDKPTVLSIDDLDKINHIGEEPIRAGNCCSCGKEDFEIFMIDGIQCQECFSKRKPRFGSSPVSNAYFEIK